MQSGEAASEAFILKSELAMRRHAVLVPAELPSAKRQKTAGSREPCACARAHAFVSDSPLSPSTQPLQIVPSVSTSESIQDPPESAGASSEEEASFAVRTNSELDAAFSEPLQTSAQPSVHSKSDLPAEATAGPGILSDTRPSTDAQVQDQADFQETLLHQQVKADSRDTQTQPQTWAKFAETKPQAKVESEDPLAQARSQQESTAGHDNSGPSSTSHETNIAAAAPKPEPDSPTSPPPLNGQSNIPTIDNGTIELNLQPAGGPTATSQSQKITVNQLLVSGPYRVDAERKHVLAQTLKRYKAKVDQVHASGRRKPDMIAFKELKQLTPERVHGHIAGLEVGARFGGRGEVAILGIHTQMMRGIDCYKGSPAYAIVMSGGYKDDVDEGLMIDYTGEGGQTGGKHTKDQTWTAGNLALRDSLRQKVPVRVVRGSTEKVNNQKELIYTYDGLYEVTAADMVTGQEGFKICKFKLKALVGHSKAGHKVTYGAIKGAKFKQLALAQRGSHTAASPQAPSATKAASRLKEQEAQRLIQLRGRPGLLLLDISHNVENRRIPVFNTVDGDQAPTGLQYIRFQEHLAATASVPATDAATQVLARADEAMGFYNQCGLTRAATTKCQYTPDGRLWETNKYGVYECAEAASSRVARHSCKDRKNRVVTIGVDLPLEVFKTANGRGWGVRCSCHIPIGGFVCDYVGKLMTDTEADQSSNDEYLFDLDHFVSIAGEPSSDVDPAKLPPLPKLGDSEEADTDVHLVLDARLQGNVARFINHSCKGNLVIQPVFTHGCNGLLYRIALFASEEIAADTELTYDYGRCPE
ncbi:hypothetical protein WJX77_007695 [Trebouxia sp. C0004]